MDTHQAILTRRSIRRYTKAPVAPELVTSLLRAGMQAPSACNQQPWQFVVITERTTREAIAAFHPYADMLRTAPVVLLVCGDLGREHFRGYWVQDCSAATQNILLAAHAAGLGAVWVGLYPREDLVAETRRVLGLPDQIVPLALIPLGVPAEQAAPTDRFDPSRVHRERW
ncbi:MAG: nitroreductase family protein [Candidatus Methylomirabilota bacterium]